MFNWFKLNKPISQYNDIYQCIAKLKNRGIENPYSSDKSLLTLLSAYNDIVSYEQALKTFIELMLSHTLVPRYLLLNKPTIIKVRNFFTQNNCFLDVEIQIQSFLESCETFIKTYEDITLLETKTFEDEKNILMLEPVIANVELIIRSLYG